MHGAYIYGAVVDTIRFWGTFGFAEYLGRHGQLSPFKSLYPHPPSYYREEILLPVPSDSIAREKSIAAGEQRRASGALQTERSAIRLTADDRDIQ
jgi:hypothetical protein